MTVQFVHYARSLSSPGNERAFVGSSVSSYQLLIFREMRQLFPLRAHKHQPIVDHILKQWFTNCNQLD